MSSGTWLGNLSMLPQGASPTAQVWAATIGSATAGQTFSVTLTDEAGGTVTFTYTAVGGDTTTTVATGLAAAVTNSQDPRASLVLATSSTNVATLTAANAGVPFYPTAGGTGTIAGAAVKSSVGANDWNTPANWAENAVPAPGANVLITGSTAILYGLNNNTALGAFASAPGNSVAVGGPGLYLKFTCTSFLWAGTGTSYINIGSSAVSPRIITTASATAPAGGLNLLGSAMTTVLCQGGAVDLAGTVGLTATATTVQVQGSNSRVRCGPGLTLTNYFQESGSGCEIDCAATSVIVDGGDLTIVGTGAITTLTVNGGTVYPESTGAIGTLNCNGGTVDLTQVQLARTVTTPKINPTATLIFDPAYVTFTTPPLPAQALGPVSITLSLAPS